MLAKCVAERADDVIVECLKPAVGLESGRRRSSASGLIQGDVSIAQLLDADLLSSVPLVGPHCLEGRTKRRAFLIRQTNHLRIEHIRQNLPPDRTSRSAARGANLTRRNAELAHAAEPIVQAKSSALHRCASEMGCIECSVTHPEKDPCPL